MKIYNGYKRLPRNYTLLADEYEHTMSAGYLNNKKNNEMAAFDIFFREVPTNGGYAVMAGIDKLIPYIENLKFSERDLDYFRRNNYPKEYIEYLKNFKFTGNIYAIPDGTPVFPNEPLVTVVAPTMQAQILETTLLSIINGAMEHATGARRIIEATPKNVDVLDIGSYKNKKVSTMEFGARRADGPEAAIDASIYGIMAGCAGTSNIMVANMLNTKALGTMAHSWVEAYPTELDAFLAYALMYPNNCILLVDTYDSLRSGIPNAIKTFQLMKEQGLPLNHIGIRIDSGDLARLSKEARKMLDQAGFPQATICLSNSLDAKSIETLIAQGACFNSLGVGDNISKPEGRMGCVYKLVAILENGIWIPKIKLSNDTIKIVNPDLKNLYRAFDKNTNFAIADIITRKNQPLTNNNTTIINLKDNLQQKELNNFYLKELQVPIFENGILVYDDPDIWTKQAYCNEQMSYIYPETKRTIMPEPYYVDGTKEYVDFKNDFIVKTRAKSRAA